MNCNPSDPSGQSPPPGFSNTTPGLPRQPAGVAKTSVLDHQPRPFGSARILLAALRGQVPGQAVIQRLSADWKDGLTLVEQDGQRGLDVWLGAVGQRDAGLADSYRTALEEARRPADPGTPPVNPGSIGPGPDQGPQRPPRLPQGTRVMAIDRGNFGEVVDDQGDVISVHFVSPSGAEHTRRFPRSQLRHPDGGPLDPVAGIPAEPFDLKVVGTREFIRADYRREWLIKRAIVKGRPGVIGGPLKCMKTSLTIEILVSLACAVRFLDSFDVPRRTKVLLISGESGGGVIQETCRRVCRSKGVDPDEMEGFAFWGFELPRLDSSEQLGALAACIRDNGIEVVIIDPLYLCLITGGRQINAANLFDVGPLLKTITETCLQAGATPLLVHHFKKTGERKRDNPYGPPELEDLSFSGIQEFARQWLLVSRMERYEPGTGEHKLWFSVGGSDGHSGEWALDISEGVADEEFSDREWKVSINRSSEARDEARQRQEKAKAEKAAERDRQKAKDREHKRCGDIEDALTILRKRPEGLTRTRWREVIGCSSRVIAPMISTLLDQGRIREGPVTTTSEKDRKNRENAGFHFVTNEIDSNATPDNAGQCRTNPRFLDRCPG